MGMAVQRYIFVCPGCGEKEMKEFLRFANSNDKLVPSKEEVEFIAGDIECRKCGNHYPVCDENLTSHP